MDDLRFGVFAPGQDTYEISGVGLSRPKRFKHPGGRKRIYTTNSIEELITYSQDDHMLMSYKLAGQPITLSYNNGELVLADYCNDGVTGYDITKTMRNLPDVPNRIADPDVTEVRGTLVVSWRAYNMLIRAGMKDGESNDPQHVARHLAASPYSNECALAGAEFLTYDMGGIKEYQSKSQIYEKLGTLGFKVVPFWPIGKSLTISQARHLQKAYSPFEIRYPAVGLVFESEQLYTNCFNPNMRRIMALNWPYDVRTTDYIGTLRLMDDLNVANFGEEIEGPAKIHYFADLD